MSVCSNTSLREKLAFLTTKLAKPTVSKCLRFTLKAKDTPSKRFLTHKKTGKWGEYTHDEHVSVVLASDGSADGQNGMSSSMSSKPDDGRLGAGAGGRGAGAAGGRAAAIGGAARRAGAAGGGAES